MAFKHWRRSKYHKAGSDHDLVMRRRARLPKIIVLDTEQRWDYNSLDEHLWWPRVLWIDPGVVSGVATVWFDPQALFDDKPLSKVILAYSEMFLQGPENGLNGQINRYLRLRQNLSGEPGLATGCESFVPRQMNMDPDFLAPVRIRAGLDYRLSTIKPESQETEGTGVPLHVQSPSDALTAFNNERLRNYRMYTPGPDHINDAKRHCLLWIRKLGARGREFFDFAHGIEQDWWRNENE